MKKIHNKIINNQYIKSALKNQINYVHTLLLKNLNINIEILLLLISAVLVIVNIGYINKADLIFSGDQYFPFNIEEVRRNIFETINFKNLGTLVAWDNNIQFFDNFLYYGFYVLKFNTRSLQYLYYFIIFYLVIRLSVFGFKRYSFHYNLNLNNIQIISVAFMYSSCPYFVQLLHGTVMNITVAIAYGLIPAIFVIFSQYFSSENINYKLGILLSILLYVAIFPFWFFASFGLMLLAYYLYAITFLKISKKFIKSLYLFLTIIPLLSYQIYNIFYQKKSLEGINPKIDEAVYGNVAGGMLMQLKMIHSWGIYNIWNPRFHYPFGSHYFSNIYNITIAVLYCLILIGIYNFFKNEKSKSLKNFLIFFLVVFFVVTFFAKGSSGYLGQIFIYFYNNVPFFSIFRTPDIRFGFTIILILSFIVLLILRNNKLLANPINIIIITISLSLPYFNGEALKGKNIGDLYYDKVIQVPSSYIEAANFINSNTKKYDFVFDLDMIDYGMFNLDHDIYSGQDIFSKLIRSPLVYGSDNNPIPFQTIQILKNIKFQNNFELFKNYPIKFIILRKNTEAIKKFITSKNLINVYENSLFIIYELKSFAPILDGCGSNFSTYNNDSFIAKVDSTCSNLILRLNYDDNWRIIDLGKNFSFLKINLLKFKNLFWSESPKALPNSYYQNEFDISAMQNNSEHYFLVYYEANFISKILLLISMLTLFFYLAIITNIFFVRSLWKKFLRV